MTKISIAADHAGFDLKCHLTRHFPAMVDLGTTSSDRVDYPDYAGLVATSLLSHHSDYGILICGSGIGMSMAANRYPGVRAALITSAEAAALARAHNNANILCLGARFCTPEEALAWTHIFLATAFEGGRHTQRVRKIG